MAQIFIEEAKSLQGSAKDRLLNLHLVELVYSECLRVSQNQSPYEAERTMAAAKQFAKTLLKERIKK